MNLFCVSVMHFLASKEIFVASNVQFFWTIAVLNNKYFLNYLIFSVNVFVRTALKAYIFFSHSENASARCRIHVVIAACRNMKVLKKTRSRVHQQGFQLVSKERSNFSEKSLMMTMKTIAFMTTSSSCSIVYSSCIVGSLHCRLHRFKKKLSEFFGIFLK